MNILIGSLLQFYLSFKIYFKEHTFWILEKFPQAEEPSVMVLIVIGRQTELLLLYDWEYRMMDPSRTQPSEYKCLPAFQ